MQVNFLKKIVCDPHVTLDFFIKKSVLIPLYAGLFTWFLRKRLFCCLKYDFTRQLHHDERFTVFFACTVSLGSFPTSTHILCVVGYVRYTTNATHDGDMLWCITAGTTH